jgi:hypothetical protein
VLESGCREVFRRQKPVQASKLASAGSPEYYAVSAERLSNTRLARSRRKGLIWSQSSSVIARVELGGRPWPEVRMSERGADGCLRGILRDWLGLIFGRVVVPVEHPIEHRVVDCALELKPRVGDAIAVTYARNYRAVDERPSEKKRTSRF